MPGRSAQASANFGSVATLDVRLANLVTPRGPAVGAEIDRGVLDVTETGASFGLEAPRDIDDLLQNGRGGAVRAILDAVEARPGDAVMVDPDAVRFAPLVTRPQKIICIGFNYRQHAEETDTPIPEAPPLFSKFANALNHDGGRVLLPTRVAKYFDYETELVVVFGRECRDVAEENALDVVAGYATGNDFSARDLQTVTTQFLAGKASDGFAPIGPWLVPAARVPDPNQLRLTTTVNGEVRQDWCTYDMIFDVRQLISYITGIFTVAPGDILFTGTPQGVVLGQQGPMAERAWLRAGDHVVSEIEGLGALRITLEDDAR